MRTVISVLAAATASLAMAHPAAAGKAATQAQIVRDLHDHQLILDLMARYGLALDAGDGAAYADLFTPDGVVIAGGGEEYRGREALMKLGASVGQPPGAPPPTGPRPPIHHLFSNVAMDIRGDAASVAAYWVVVNGKTGVPVMQSMGRYEDTLIKQGGRWRFTRRQIVNETLLVSKRLAAQPAK